MGDDSVTDALYDELSNLEPESALALISRISVCEEARVVGVQAPKVKDLLEQPKELGSQNWLQQMQKELPEVLHSEELSSKPAGTVVMVAGLEYQMSRAGKWWPRTTNRGGNVSRRRHFQQQVAAALTRSLPQPPSSTARRTWSMRAR